MAFGTRFFAPRTRISPSSGVPPWTSSTSSLSVPVMNLAFRRGAPPAKPEEGGQGAREKGKGRNPPIRKANAPV
ncbi:hypothetical protein GCM10010336_38390 [Streptomyces goshikiensis]|nr:hypothetical protein GCM10010336_38390 [Streptomyces goshikiensis]